MSTERRLAEHQLLLIDHHVHGTIRTPLQRTELEGMLSESDRAIPGWMTQFDSQVGLAVRRWCAPLLDLQRHASADIYFVRRSELGDEEVTRRLLRASGVGEYVLETGHAGDQVLGPAEMAEISGRATHEVVRLEATFENLVVTSASIADAIDGFADELAARSRNAVGLKSIVAYRFGLDFEPERPTRQEVMAAASSWLSSADPGSPPRVDDPTLLRFILWAGVDTGLPIQLHTGYGDPDLELHRCDPLLLTRFIKLVEPHGVDLILLHSYPYHRNAGYLAQVFPHVYFDVGLGVNYTGLRSDAIIAESLELAPFAKILFSSDAWGPPELHYLGAELWRRGMQRALSGWVDADECSFEDAIHILNMVGRDNAERVYGLSTV